MNIPNVLHEWPFEVQLKVGRTFNWNAGIYQKLLSICIIASANDLPHNEFPVNVLITVHRSQCIYF